MLLCNSFFKMVHKEHINVKPVSFKTLQLNIYAINGYEKASLRQYNTKP